jgi:uncharacterized FlgJ-related protein
MLLIKRLIKRKVLVLALMGLMFTAANAQNKKYINNHKILATVLSERYGIPASVILAVASIESSGGAGPTAKVLNNHFGMEGKNNIVVNGRKSRYKQYNNVVASYIDFCEVVSRKKFYPTLKGNENPKVWVKALSRAGYSEMPEEWESKVFSVLHKNKL